MTIDYASLIRPLLGALDDLVPTEVLTTTTPDTSKMLPEERAFLRDKVQAHRQKWGMPELDIDEEPTTADVLQVVQELLK